ncbi:PREDICTED: disease resistance protein RPS5-like [Brassica oleracea var. oleracea]|nr:PREDICTED: disease resistance protein RPS5-like [Brassica oleracea var. oleracea]
MHDVVREMALWIASDFGKDKERCIVKAGVGLPEVPTVENWRSVRRMSLMDNGIGNISDSPNCPELTTLLFQKNEIVNISDQLVNAYREANAIQAISIRFIEEESILNLPDMAALSKLDMFRSGMVEVNVMRSTSSWNKNPTTPSFPNLSTVTLSYCHGLKDLTWLLFAPNLKALYVVSSAQVEDIISKEKAANILTEEVGTIIPFRKLEHFQVNSLPQLKSIYWNPLPFPRLRNFSIVMCPNLRKLPLNSRSGSSFEGEELVIHNGEQEWIDKVEWEDEATKERFLLSFNPALY